MAKKPTPEYFEGQYRAAARAIDENNIEDLRRIASQVDDLDILGRDEITLLFYAIVRQNMAAIKTLVELGANPQAGNAAEYPDTLTPLQFALKHEDPKYLVAMLDGGLSPDYESIYIARWGTEYRTPIIALAVIGGEHHIPLLLERGADINATATNGDTVLHSAASARKPDLAIYLIRQGADINTFKTNGASPARAVYNNIEREPANSKWHRKWKEVGDLMIQRGVKWPPDPPDVVRARMEAQDASGQE